jgi:hypothetical protein
MRIPPDHEKPRKAMQGNAKQWQSNGKAIATPSQSYRKAIAKPCKAMLSNAKPFSCHRRATAE